jgi:hypothetical protein
MSGLNTLVRAPWSYKRGGTQRYKTQAHSDTLILSHSQVHTSSQAQYITQWSKVLCSAVRTTLNPCVFLRSFRFHLTGKMFRPLLILRFRAGAFRHPAGDFLSDSGYGFVPIHVLVGYPLPGGYQLPFCLL